MKRILFLIFTASLFLQSSPVHAIVVPPASSSLPASAEPNKEEVKAAIAELKGLSKKEKRERIKNVKKEWKEYKAAKKVGKKASTNTILLCILAVLLPPLAVYLHEGEINNRFWLSILLWILFILPGIIYALILILGDK